MLGKPVPCRTFHSSVVTIVTIREEMPRESVPSAATHVRNPLGHLISKGFGEENRAGTLGRQMLAGQAPHWACRETVHEPNRELAC